MRLSRHERPRRSRRPTKILPAATPLLLRHATPEASATASAFQGVQRRRNAEWDLFNERWRSGGDVETEFEIEREPRLSVLEALARLAEVASGSGFGRFARFDDDDDDA